MIFADWLIVSALVAGVIGSVHCAGMCGGIVGALTVASGAAARSIPIHATQSARSRALALPLAYNAGRIVSYGIAGAFVGGLGNIAGAGVDNGWLGDANLNFIGRIIAGSFMIALGFYLTAWWRGLAVLEDVGAKLWRRLEPYGRALLPPRNRRQGFALGLLWGWLPCGMVYTALAGALASGDAIRGALTMLAFGAGTLPMLLGLSIGARGAWLAQLRRERWRTLAGVAFIAVGAYGIMSAPLHDRAAAHTHAAHAPA